MNNQTIISRLAFVAGLCVFAMFLVTVFTGISQEQFEITKNVTNYANSLVVAQNPLRIIFSIDIVFICVFVTLFVFLTQHLKRGDYVSTAVADVALGAMLICGLLDFHEDLHILTMMHSAINNLPIEPSQIQMQMLFSMIKFCTSYLSLFLLAFLLPNRTMTEKLLKYSLLFVQVPVGVLVYTAPENLQLLFNLIRFVFMISGFFLLAYIFSQITDEQ